MRFSTFVLKNVFRRRARSTLTMTGMAVAVAAVVALVGLADGFQKSFLEIYTRRGVALIVSSSDKANPLTSTMPDSIGDEISKVPGVVGVCPGLVDQIAMNDSATVIVQGWPVSTYMWGQIKVVSGQMLGSQDLGKKHIMIGAELAERADIKVGSTVKFSDDSYQVVGVYDSVSDLEKTFVLMLLQDAQKVCGKKRDVTGCTVMLSDNSNQSLEAVRAEIEGPIAAGLGLSGKLRAKRPSEFVEKNNQVRIAKGMAIATSFVGLLIGFISVLNTMIMSVFERTREIGILRAIGWRPQRVMLMIIMESILLSVGGAILGTLFGLGLIAGMRFVPTVSGVVSSSITPKIVIEGFAISIIVGIIGAAYPAFRGSRLLPTEALRHE